MKNTKMMASLLGITLLCCSCSANGKVTAATKRGDKEPVETKFVFEETTPTTESETSGSETEAEVTSDITLETTESGMPAAYAALIDDYCTAVQNDEDRTESALYELEDIYSINDPVNTKIYVSDSGIGLDPLKDFGYKLLDIDEDGTDELLIGCMNDDVVPYQSVIYTTDAEGNAVRLFYSWARNQSYVSGRQTICSSGSNGAAWYTTTKYKFAMNMMFDCQLDGITLESGETVYLLTSDPNQVYDIFGDEDVDNYADNMISESEAETWFRDAQPMHIDYTSFEAYLANK